MRVPCFHSFPVINHLYSTGIRLYSGTDNPRTRLLSLAAVLSLITCFVHSFLDNFLDMDDAAISFWMSFSLIVVLDIKEHQHFISKQ